MIVIGVDPGARQTGIAVVSILREPESYGAQAARLIRSTTVERDKREPMLQVSLGYLTSIAAVLLDAVRDLGPDLIAIEGLRKPTGFARGQKHSIDPGPLVAVGIVLGSILGRTYGVEAVVVEPGRNGSAPLTFYPEALRPTRGTGAGTDRLRHERSAYDVAVQGPARRVLAAKSESLYA